MLTNVFLVWILVGCHALFPLLPDITWSVDTEGFQYFLSIVKTAGYLLPMQTVAEIVGIVIGFTIFRILVALFKTVWDVLPIV